jgi:hypothetical protein
LVNGPLRSLQTVERGNRDQRRGRRFPHFVAITLRPRKDGRAQQVGQSVDFSLAGMKIRVEGERLPGRVFRVFLPQSEPPQVCGVGEVRWERRMPHACEFGLAFRTTTSHYRDLIRELRGAGRKRSLAQAIGH